MGTQKKNKMSNPSERLLLAAATGNLKNVQTEIANKADINSTDLNGYAPIHCAVYNNKVEVVKLLVQKGANVLMKDTHAYVGFTPLHYISAFGSIEMAKALLLTKEKDVHCKNLTGQTPADVASTNEMKTLLMLDQQTRNFSSQVKKILQEPQQQQQPEVPEVVTEEPEVVLTENKKCYYGNSCKKGKKILKMIIALIFFGIPAFQMLTTPHGFPYYIFSCSLIIYIGGLVKICKKARVNEGFKAKKHLAIHGWTFVVVNILSILINALTVRAPMFMYVLLFTGVFLLFTLLM